MENNQENKNTFKQSTNDLNYTISSDQKEISGISFGSKFLIPFFSGMIGATLVIVTVLGVPSIRTVLFETDTSNNIDSTPTTSNSTTTTGYVEEVSLSNYSDTAVYAANKIAPSIVGIQVEFNVNSSISLFNNQTSTSSASGSGIIISEDGYILTNNHIISTSSSSDSYYQMSDATKITVKLANDDTEYTATIIGQDEQTDLAIIKIDATGLTPAEFADSDNIKVGEFALAIGNPLGLEGTVTTGIISGVDRTVTDEDGQEFTLIQTDAAINSGNSGGALVNSQGQVIGINTLKLSGTGIESMGFAIPINSTIDITADLIEYNKVIRPYIGITGMDLTEKTAEDNDLVVGIYVKSIEDFSAAEKAGIKPGDVIIAADGQSITTFDELNEIKNSKNVGDELTLKINRNGEEKDLTVILSEQP